MVQRTEGEAVLDHVRAAVREPLHVRGLDPDADLPELAVVRADRAQVLVSAQHGRSEAGIAPRASRVRLGGRSATATSRPTLVRMSGCSEVGKCSSRTVRATRVKNSGSARKVRSTDSGNPPRTLAPSQLGHLRVGVAAPGLSGRPAPRPPTVRHSGAARTGTAQRRASTGVPNSCNSSLRRGSISVNGASRGSPRWSRPTASRISSGLCGARSPCRFHRFRDPTRARTFASAPRDVSLFRSPHSFPIRSRFARSSKCTVVVERVLRDVRRTPQAELLLTRTRQRGAGSGPALDATSASRKTAIRLIHFRDPDGSRKRRIGGIRQVNSCRTKRRHELVAKQCRIRPGVFLFVPLPVDCKGAIYAQGEERLLAGFRELWAD